MNSWFTLQRRFSAVFAPLVICVIGVLTYSNTWYSDFQFDDVPSIVLNPAIKNPFDLLAIWHFWPTRFITYYTFSWNYYFSQNNVFWYHVANCFIHVLTSLLVWWFVRLLFFLIAQREKKIIDYAESGSLLAAMLFVVHPVQTQAVTYIVQRATSLSACFYLLAVCLFIKSRLALLKGGKWFYGGSFLSGVMAQFCKENALTLVGSLILIECFFFAPFSRKNLLRLAPFLLFLAVVPVTLALSHTFDWTHWCRVGEDAVAIHPVSYFLTQLRVYLIYARLLIAPVSQNVDYDIAVVKSFFEPAVLWGSVYVFALFFVVIKLFKRYRIISFAILWGGMVLFPESSFFPIQDVIFEHRLYLAVVGYCCFVVFGVYYLLGRKYKIVSVLILSLLILWYAFLAYARNFDWQTNVSLWDDAISKSPAKARCYLNRGVGFLCAGESKKALNDFERYVALLERDSRVGSFLQQEVSPVDAQMVTSAAMAKRFNEIGLHLTSLGKVAQASPLFLQAVMLFPENEEYAINHCASLGRQKNFKNAIKAGEDAERYFPQSGMIQYNLAIALFWDAQYSFAWGHLNKALEFGVKPDPRFVAELKSRLEEKKGN